MYFAQNDEADDLAAAQSDDHLVGSNDVRVVVGHRSRPRADAVDVVAVGRPDQLGQARDIRRRRPPQGRPVIVGGPLRVGLR